MMGLKYVTATYKLGLDRFHSVTIILLSVEQDMRAVDEWAELVRKAKGGDAQAEAHILSILDDYLHAIAHNVVPPALRRKVGASDIVQKALITAHAGLASFRGASQFQMRAWLKKILRNSLLDELRKFGNTQRRSLERELNDFDNAASLETLPASIESPSKIL